MKSKDDVENLEKLIGQLQGLHAEISQLDASNNLFSGVDSAA